MEWRPLTVNSYPLEFVLKFLRFELPPTSNTFFDTSSLAAAFLGFVAGVLASRLCLIPPAKEPSRCLVPPLTHLRTARVIVISIFGLTTRKYLYFIWRKTVLRAHSGSKLDLHVPIQWRSTRA
ncbi:hypothetical protein GALMADRAFT_920863 [Galerina marginata CBS 339.88]|uniref:Uncharacterized protein n=1 Tax=Galerina marginata (strain CBS 339.88) TaxID=685588 RepID=A0A067SP58_GALM3|nr:hypothetical protein GALMADRAFT_920863 [Galerina marginata CBS 339.88]